MVIVLVTFMVQNTFMLHIIGLCFQMAKLHYFDWSSQRTVNEIFRIKIIIILVPILIISLIIIMFEMCWLTSCYITQGSEKLASETYCVQLGQI